jgi:hypothetical protein
LYECMHAGRICWWTYQYVKKRPTISQKIPIKLSRFASRTSICAFICAFICSTRAHTHTHICTCTHTHPPSKMGEFACVQLLLSLPLPPSLSETHARTHMLCLSLFPTRYDAVVTGDGPMDYVHELVERLITRQDEQVKETGREGGRERERCSAHTHTHTHTHKSHTHTYTHTHASHTHTYITKFALYMRVTQRECHTYAPKQTYI